MARSVQLLRHDAYCPIVLNCPIAAEMFLDLHNFSHPTKPHSIIANNTKKQNFL